MSDFAKKQLGYKALKKRLKAKDKAIQRLRNRAAWLELQLTMHFADDQRAEDDIYTEIVEDDCIKCQQLRKMLGESLHLPLISELRKLNANTSDVVNESIALSTDPESAIGGNRQEVMLTIDPSHHSMSGNQENNALNAPPEDHGFFGGSISDNVCCAFIVVVAIFLVSCF
ncbi:hypothetical protein ACROYT_G022854 [Oculina patagonica]